MSELPTCPCHHPPPCDRGAAPCACACVWLQDKDKDVITWSSVDRLNMSIGLLYALCNHALDSSIR